MIPEWQLVLRDQFYGGEFDYNSLMAAIEKNARFESLVHMPEKKDPDWPNWCARATTGDKSISGKGETDLEALGSVLSQILSL